MCILELSKVLMYEFRYDYIKNKYDNKSKLLFTDTDSLMYEIKIKILAGIKKCLISVIIRLGQNTMIIQSNSHWKNDSETRGVAIEEFVGLKPKMYCIILVDNNEHKKTKGINKNVVATINHNEYKDVLLIKECIRHSMNRI